MARQLLILTFHELCDDHSAISFPPDLFQRGLRRLSESGFRTVDLLQVGEMIRRGIPLPDRRFVITLDDGFQSVYERAFPTLMELKMTATVFLTVGQNGKAAPSTRLPQHCGRQMLNWSEIREMHHSGIGFGAHTLTHPDLTRLPIDRVEMEICESKRAIEEALETPVRSFAYPFGRYDQRSRGVVEQHFECGCSDRLGLVTATSDRFALQRVDAYYLRTDRLFDLLFSRRFNWYVRARSIPRCIRRTVDFRQRSDG